MKKMRFERLRQPPVFCEQCPNLAMAVVEDSPLCQKCMAEVMRHRSALWVRDNTRPLEIAALEISPVASTHRSRFREDDTDSGFVA